MEGMWEGNKRRDRRCEPVVYRMNLEHARFSMICHLCTVSYIVQWKVSDWGFGMGGL